MFTRLNRNRLSGLEMLDTVFVVVYLVSVVPFLSLEFGCLLHFTMKPGVFRRFSSKLEFDLKKATSSLLLEVSSALLKSLEKIDSLSSKSDCKLKALIFS